MSILWIVKFEFLPVIHTWEQTFIWFWISKFNHRELVGQGLTSRDCGQRNKEGNNSVYLVGVTERSSLDVALPTARDIDRCLIEAQEFSRELFRRSKSFGRIDIHLRLDESISRHWCAFLHQLFVTKNCILSWPVVPKNRIWTGFRGTVAKHHSQRSLHREAIVGCSLRETGLHRGLSVRDPICKLSLAGSLQIGNRSGTFAEGLKSVCLFQFLWANKRDSWRRIQPKLFISQYFRYIC